MGSFRMLLYPLQINFVASKQLNLDCSILVVFGLDGIHKLINFCGGRIDLKLIKSYAGILLIPYRSSLSSYFSVSSKHLKSLTARTELCSFHRIIELAV